MFKGYTGMELLKVQLEALIVVLAAVVVAAALAVVQNKQGEPLRGFIL